jgi:pimeloyl-ACP methyl ester carboxylesterase
MTRREAPFRSGVSTCAAWLYEATRGGAATTVVMAHGATLTRADGLDRFAGAFARAGADVLVFDHLNLGDSTGPAPSRVRIAEQQADWRAAVAHARGLAGREQHQIVLWGFSLSAVHAATLAARDHTIAAALLLCPAVGIGGRLRSTSLRQAAWITPRILLDLAGRRTLVPVTGPPGSRAAMTAPGEAEGFASVVGATSRWRNELSAGVLGEALLRSPVRHAAAIGCPLWIGLGDRDRSVDPRVITMLARRAPRAELHHLPHDHFSAFQPHSAVPAQQVDFLRRTVLRP